MDENNELVSVSMNIILNAGDGRTEAFKALEEARKGNFEEAANKIKLAEEKIKAAHVAQTEVMQNEINGKAYDLCILFIHAQDTLMTIKSELSLITEMIKMYKDIDALKKEQSCH